MLQAFSGSWTCCARRRPWWAASRVTLELRPLAFSMLAELVHHVRSDLSPAPALPHHLPLLQVPASRPALCSHQTLIDTAPSAKDLHRQQWCAAFTRLSSCKL